MKVTNYFGISHPKKEMSRLIFQHKKRTSALVIILVFLGFAVFFYGSRTESASHEEYLNELEGPYKKFYTSLSGFTERPSPAKMDAIYDEFEEELQLLEIRAGLEGKKGEAYKQFLAMPEIYRQDYKDSAYKYSTIVGQANNAKMVLDYIGKQK